MREDPKRPSTHYYLGVAQERRGRLPDAYVALARVYMAQGERALALEALDKAAELNPALKK